MEWLIVVATAVAVLLTVVLLGTRSGRDDGEDGAGGDEGGGGNDRLGPPRPPGAPCDGEPEWWPEFERAFAAYAARQRRPSRSVGRPVSRLTRSDSRRAVRG